MLNKRCDIERLKQQIKRFGVSEINSDQDIKVNSEKYPDPTAYQAIKNVEQETENERNEYDRRDKLLAMIFSLCDLSGFHLEERIVVKDLKTGRVWR